jgi:hypothetical protein
MAAIAVGGIGETRNRLWWLAICRLRRGVRTDRGTPSDMCGGSGPGFHAEMRSADIGISGKGSNDAGQTLPERQRAAIRSKRQSEAADIVIVGSDLT